MNYEDVDKDGKLVQYQIPYFDAEQRAKVSSEMGGEFRRQFNEQLQTARMFSMSGVPYDKDAFAAAAKNAGHDQNFINAETDRLDQMQSSFGSANARYDVGKTLDNDAALAYAGKPPIGTYDQATLQKAFPKDPDKVQDIINQANQLHQVAGFVGGLSTRTMQENAQELAKFAPSATSPIDFVQQHEGGYVSNDSGKGPTNFGINQEANSDIDVKKLTKEQAANIIQTRYANPIGADKMSPQMAAVAIDSAVNMGVGKTKELLAQAGDDPQKLIDLRRTEYQRLATNDPARYGGSLAGWNSRLDDLQKSLPSIGQAQNFGEQSQLYGKMQQALSAYQKSLNDDPAGTITSSDQHLTDMYNAGTKDPAKMNDYINAVSARQEALQVPQESRAVLPQSYATFVTKNIMDNPQTAPATMNKLQTQFGDNWPNVYHSLVTQGGLPTYYQSVATLGTDPKTERDGTLLARWAGDEDGKGKTDADLVGQENVTAVKKIINADPNLQNLMTSIYQSGGSKSDVDGLLHSVQSLAFAKQYYDKDANAAQDALEAFTSKYKFMSQGGARVPADLYDNVSNNAAMTLESLETKAAIPPDYATGIHGALTPQQYFDWVKNSPTWVTSPNEQALRLKDPQDRLVRGKDGKPLEVPFNAATAANPESRAFDMIEGDVANEDASKK